jgi:hypothetical protein
MSQYRADRQTAGAIGPTSQTSFLLPSVSAQFRTALEDPLYPWTLRGASQDRIGTKAEFAQLDGECVGETDQCPLVCRVSAPVGIRIADNDPLRISNEWLYDSLGEKELAEKLDLCVPKAVTMVDHLKIHLGSVAALGR